MRRMQVAVIVLGALVAPACESVDLGALAGLLGSGEMTEETLVAGLRDALRVGTDRAVERLSKKGGFAKSAALRIPLPEELESLGSTLRKVGMGRQVDLFEEKMNEAAESAVTEAAPVFLEAITSMTFDDARRILDGRPDEATRYFKRATHTRLEEMFLPVVRDHMSQVGAVRQYRDLADRYAQIPLAPRLEFSPDTYITGKALDGLFAVLARAEQDIREDPAARTTALLKQVFGGR